MAYMPIVPQRLIEITQLFSVHYFEYTSSYRFSGESHDFWELLYVDNGAVQVVAGEEVHSLSRGQMIFHQPGEFHALSANGAVAPNLVVVSFQCRSPALDFFRRQLTAIPANWEAALEKARAHGDDSRAHTELVKLDAVRIIREKLEEQA